MPSYSSLAGRCEVALRPQMALEESGRRWRGCQLPGPRERPWEPGSPKAGRAECHASDTAGPSRLWPSLPGEVCERQHLHFTDTGQEKLNLFRCPPLSGTEKPGHCPFVLLCWETQSNSAELPSAEPRP
uniref:Uncharacterized protein n=1 Tax=Myotis myotis TaxID=51298 RepID=A0A7J7TJS9_MYOMY|nr:hypothetical protein mMyoMyo1_009103 [Myotis myotis]